VRFVGVGAGLTEIARRDGAIRDSVNQSVPFECVPGTIEFLTPTRVEESGWGRLKQIYR